jgi:hypothetical protein
VSRLGAVVIGLCLGLTSLSYAQDAPKPADDPVQLKATIVKLQQAVLERDRELGTLRAQLAEMQLAALGAAVKTMDPAVQTALGIKPETPPVVADATKKPSPK